MVKVNQTPVGYLYSRTSHDGVTYRNFAFTLEGAKSVANVDEIFAVYSAEEPCFVVEDEEGEE